jgi:HAMP domain-containing protein
MSMDRHPVATARRRRFEAFIRLLDLIVYAGVFLGGVYALLGTPATVADELQGAEWLVMLWALLLLVGGLSGFVGRLTRYWFVEVPATVLAFFGIVIYFVVLGRFAFTSITAAVAAAMVLVAQVAMARRWAELQIFATDPDATDFKTRMADALRRRTTNFVHRHR